MLSQQLSEQPITDKDHGNLRGKLLAVREKTMGKSMVFFPMSQLPQQKDHGLPHGKKKTFFHGGSHGPFIEGGVRRKKDHGKVHGYYVGKKTIQCIWTTEDGYKIVGGV